MANQKTTITEPQREIPVRAEVDVLVVGGGPAGIMAARAAAGKGLRVMLIESRGYLGGNLTIGLPILGYLGRKGNQIIKGLPQLFIDRLRARGAAGEHRPCKLHVSLTIIDPEEAKTVALEIAEQLNWEMPDYLAISVGDGCTIAGVWKGFKDLYAIGFIDKLPRLISAQSLGCYPINRAIQEDKPWEPMEENTIADSISVGVPRNADKALMAIRESNGIAVNVSDEEILAAQRLLGRTCGVFGEPAGVTGAAALKKACEQGLIPHDATVVSVVTGNGLKDVANAIKSAGEPIHIAPDLELMVEEFKKRGVTVE